MLDSPAGERPGVTIAEQQCALLVFYSSTRRHTSYWRDWISDVCSSDRRRAEGHVACCRRSVKSRTVANFWRHHAVCFGSHENTSYLFLADSVVTNVACGYRVSGPQSGRRR